MDVANSMNTLDDVLGCVRQRLNSKNEMDRKPETRHRHFGSRKSESRNKVLDGTSEN